MTETAISDLMSMSTSDSLDLLNSIFVFVIGLVALVIAILFVIDVTQTRDAVRRNFPVIGRFRGLFTHLGEFFRQYFFAMDREEMPFNRAEREWVYRAARGADNTVSFGSTRALTPVGTPIFVSCPFPTLERDAAETAPLVIGPYARHPYEARSIVNISGMSFGALSAPAIHALSKGASAAECWLNTGEGGVSTHHLDGGGDLVFQIGTAKYGVRDAGGRLSNEKLREIASLPQVKMFEIKLSQGAKPGKGGILPAEKVTSEIAAARGIAVGEASISPNRHPDIDDEADLLDMVHRIRETTGKPVGFKTVIGAYGWLERLCEEINARGPESAPDFIAVDGGDGGTGAAPMALMDSVGLPLREALPKLVDILARAGLRDRVHVVASGKLVTPAEAAWAICAGANFVVTGRGAMFALGCIQAMKCNKNTCPTGVTTHNPRLQRGLDPTDKAIKVENFIRGMRHGVEVIAHSCGVPEPRRLRRMHVRIVQQNGASIPLDELHPTPSPSPRAAA